MYLYKFHKVTETKTLMRPMGWDKLTYREQELKAREIAVNDSDPFIEYILQEAAQ